jgi:undecaprenol kinase
MKKQKLLKSFKHAFLGILFCLRSERNMQIHATATVLVLLIGTYVQVTKMEWLVLLLTIGGVLSLEMVNTALEKTVDLATAERHPLAKIAKDAAAGAVLVFSCIAVVIGLVIFIPYL